MTMQEIQNFRDQRRSKNKFLEHKTTKNETDLPNFELNCRSFKEIQRAPEKHDVVVP